MKRPEKSPESSGGIASSARQDRVGVCAEAFDVVADRYDDDFTNRSDVQILRQAVLDRVQAYMRPEQSILDVGCGTGEDALHLARLGFQLTCTDGSTQMLQIAQRKLREYRDRVELHPVDHENLIRFAELQDLEFDGILSNFGALNTLPRMSPVKTLCDHFLRPGGYVFFCLINRFHLRELLKGEWRRLQGKTAIVRCGGREVLIYYHSPEAFKWSGYTVLQILGLSVFLRSDVRFRWPLNRLGDHFLIILRKSPGRR